MAVGIVTGASRGLGLALAEALASRGWHLVVDARDGPSLEVASKRIRSASRGPGVAAAAGRVTAVPGDITSPLHRGELVAAARALGGLDLIVNNASSLGPSPLPALSEYPLDDLQALYQTNAIAPLALVQLVIPLLRANGGRIINITSDAAVEGYEGWGGYGSSKAALEQLSRVLAAENPDLRVYWVDPGDMRTQMHQAAFPGEDISDRPLPEESVPGILALVDDSRPSGRYQVQHDGGELK